jgi:hypothetical protein
VQDAGQRLLGAIRIEDGVLAAWSVALPGVATWLGAAPSGSGTDTSQPLVGAVELVAILGAFAAILTRPPDQPHVRLGSADAPRWVICGPLIGGLAFAADGATQNLGLRTGDWAIGLAFLAILVGTLAADHLPVVDAPVRRLLVMPFILVCAGFFNGFAADILGSFDIGQAFNVDPAAGVGFGIFILVLLFGGIGVFYAMFVVAPRELADPEDAGFRWLLRFSLFVVSSLVGIGWLALIGG